VGKLQREGLVTHLIADHMVDLTSHLRDMTDLGLPPAASLAQADEIGKPGQNARNRRANDRTRRIQGKSYPSRNFH
jgi:hypothetical protein